MLSVIYKLGRCIAPNADVLEDGQGAYFDNFGELPDEVVLCVMSFLNRKIIISRMELVSHRFNRLAKNEFLWWNITFNKRGRSSQVLEPSVRLFDCNPSSSDGIKLKLNCRDYYMEKILVKRSCDNNTNRMLSTPQTPSTPGGDSSPTTLKKKLRMSWRPSLLNTETTTQLFMHDRNFEKRMKLCQEANKEGHVNPHARHRHTITCTTPDESSFVMVGGFKNANHAAAVAAANATAEEPIDDTDVVHEFSTKAAHFKQIRIKKGDGSPMTPTPSTPGSPFSPFSIQQYQQQFGTHLRTDSWGSTSGSFATSSSTPRTPGHTRTASFGSSKPLQFGKHSCVCVDNRLLFLFGGTEGENTTVTNNLYIYDLETKDWMKQEYAPDELQPTPRTNHQAALVTGPDGRREMYVVGGGIGQHMTPTDEIWALDIETMLWRRVEVNLKPDQKTCPFTPRLGFTMAEVNNKLIVYGGGYWYQNGNDKRWKEYYRELFVFDVKTGVWTNIDMGHCIDQVPRSGTFPVSCRVGAHLFVVGGGIVWDVSAEVNILDLVTFKWRKVNSEQAYAADSSACITIKDYSDNTDVPKTKILLFGGYRYKPLNEYKVFSVKWKDLMAERGMNSVVLNAPDVGAINTSS